jgi:peptidoglycan/xylan/chitin deacetylase (PgdA/CDA1 family)
LQALAASPLIEIGAHTRTHPRLSELPPERQREEIAGSKADLEAMLGRPIRGFAYPFGSSGDYAAAAVAAAREAGFAYACANVQGPVSLASSPFELPRVIVRDWTAREFARRF